MDKEIDFFNIERNNINGSGTESLFDRFISNKKFLIYSELRTNLKANMKNYQKTDMRDFDDFNDDLKDFDIGIKKEKFIYPKD